MKRASVLCAVLLLLGSAVASGQPSAAQKLPQEVLVFAEVGSLVSFQQKMTDLVVQLDPDAMVDDLTEEMPEDVMKTLDPSTVDLQKSFHVVILEVEQISEPVFVFTVTDPARYLDSLIPELDEEGEEDGIHVYFEAPGDFGAGDEWGNPLAIGIVGNRAALGSDVEAVKKAVALMEAGALAAEPLFADADMGGMVRLRRLLDALDAQDQNPFDLLRRQMSMGMAMGMAMGGAGGMDMQGMVETSLDGVEGLALQIDAAEGGFSLPEGSIEAWARMQPVEGSGLAEYVAQMPRGSLDLLKYLPADALAVYGGKIGDISPFAEWYGRLIEAMVPAEDDSSAEALTALMLEGAAAVGDEMAVAFSRSPEGPLLVVSACKSKDAVAMQRFFEAMPERLSEAQAALGVRTEMTLHPAAVSYKGCEITEWEFDYQFGETFGAFPPGMDMTAVQEAAVKAAWGDPMKGYSTFLGDVCLYAQGVGSLEALKAAIDGQAQSLAGSDKFAGALAGRAETPIFVGYLSLEEFVAVYVDIIKASLAGAGMAQMIPDFRFESGPPISVAVWVTEEGAVEKRVHVPVSAITNIADGVRQAIVPQEPFMMP